MNLDLFLASTKQWVLVQKMLFLVLSTEVFVKLSTAGQKDDTGKISLNCGPTCMVYCETYPNHSVFVEIQPRP